MQCCCLVRDKSVRKFLRHLFKFAILIWEKLYFFRPMEFCHSMSDELASFQTPIIICIEVINPISIAKINLKF